MADSYLHQLVALNHPIVQYAFCLKNSGRCRNYY